VGPSGFRFFQFIQNWLNFKKSKFVPYIAPKIPNFCMCLAWCVINNCLNYTDAKLPTEKDLKIQEQIQYLNFDEF
jgi:hypothetical protein